MKKNIFLAALFLIAFSERVFFDLGPNVELVTTAVILSSFYIGRKQSFWLIFLVMLFSDLVIGNTNIFIFTWTGFLIPALFVKYFSNSKNSIFKKSLTGTFAGTLTNGFFFIWTNFGVWMLTSMYPKTELGLITSYINAIPFLRPQIVSTLIFVPLGILLTELILFLLHKYKPESKFKYQLSLNKSNQF